MPTPSVSPKTTTNPTLAAAPPPPPAEQPQQAAQAQAQAPQAPAPAKTGYATQDAFGVPQREAAQKAQLGDAFQAPETQPVALQAPAPPLDPMKAAREEVLRDPRLIDDLRSDALFKDTEMMGKLKDVGALAAPQVDPSKTTDPKDPTAGMSEAEREKYDALPEDQKKRYDELHEQACNTPPPGQSVQALRDVLANGEMGKYLEVEDSVKDNPEAKADLQKLLFSGTLEQRSGYDGRTTLSSLHELATGTANLKGDPPLKRQEVLAGLLKDLARPDTMNQGDDNTDCGPTGGAYVMATTDPAEYARVITTLAEKGEVNLTPVFARLMGQKSDIIKWDGKHDDGRPITQAILAPGLKRAAEAAAAAGETDPLAQLAARMIAEMFGLNGQEVVDMMNMGAGVNGGGWKPAYMPKADDPQRAQAEQDAEKLLEGASKENPVMALIDGHWVTVTGMEGNPPKVTYQGEDGKTHTVPLYGDPEKGKPGFMDQLNTICFQGGDVPPSMNDPKNGGRGGGGDRDGALGGGN